MDTVLSKSGFKKFISSVHDLHMQEILFLKFNRYLFQVIRHIRKFTGIFWRSTLLTITFNLALFFFGNFSKKKIFSSDAFLRMVSIFKTIRKGNDDNKYLIKYCIRSCYKSGGDKSAIFNIFCIISCCKLVLYLIYNTVSYPAVEVAGMNLYI